VVGPELIAQVGVTVDQAGQTGLVGQIDLGRTGRSIGRSTGREPNPQNDIAHALAFNDHRGSHPTTLPLTTSTENDRNESH